MAITILAHKSRETIRRCVESALGQDYPGVIEIRVREQAGDDEEFSILQKTATGAHQPNRTVILSRGENLGFAAGHNALIKKSHGEFVLCLNADAVLKKDFLSRALPAFNEPAIGTVQGKLLRWNIGRNDTMRGPNNKPIIDTTGLLPLRNRRILNRGQGEEDRGQYDAPEEIFGADGAAPLYRRAALEDVAISLTNDQRPTTNDLRVEYFDEDFFMYKEDVDLSWRLQWQGWKTMYVPQAVAWHGRGSGDSAARSPLQILAERRKLSRKSKYWAFVNQRLVQVKNESWRALLRDLPFWLPKEIASWGWVLLTEPYTLPSIGRIVKLAPRAFKKRKWIMIHRKPDANPYRWLT